MRTAFALSIAALAGSALAAPYYGQNVKEVKKVHVVVQTVVHTVFQTEGYPVATPTPSPEPVYQAPEPTPEPEAPAPTPTPVYEAPAQPTYDAVPVATPTPEAPAPVAPSSGYQAIVDEWRSKLGLKALANSAKLEANALDTVTKSNGEMKHFLNEYTSAQVLAPGTADNFLHVFVGGWLCEIPTLFGLDGICATQSDGWTYQGQTGHAEILTSPSYSEIGCALYAGIWCCDLH